MKDIIFRGAGVAIITPFNETGINFAEFGRIIDDQIAGGTDAIVAAGTTGESATLSDEEHRAVVKFAVDHVKGRVPVIAGAGSNETAYAAELAKHAESAGADAILAVTPYYNKCTQKGLVKHYTAIADAVNIPLIVYNVPSRTGVNIAPETYAALAEHPRINAAKEASGNISAVVKMQKLCGDKLNLYSGNDDQIVPILSLGGLGVISVLSNVAPRAVHDICENFFAGRTDAAAKMQIDCSDLIDALFCEVNPIPVKAAMELLGYKTGGLRMPLTDMEPQNLEKLKAAMKAHGLI